MSKTLQKLEKDICKCFRCSYTKKNKVLRGNQKPHDDKNLRKDIMHYALAIRKANKNQILR